jgi:hypothetical protein
MNDEELIWDNYYKSILTEGFDSDNIKVLDRFLRTYYSESRVVLTGEEEIINFNIKQVERHPNFNPKPQGLWYSKGNEWADFLKYDPANWADTYNNVFLLDIDLKKILKIDSYEKLLSFSRKYSDGKEYVDWEAVENLGYHGVEIIPYQGEARHNIPWYYRWDVASGCIWNTDCILKSTKVYPRTKNKR